MRVAIIFDSFGPYHLARLRAVSRTCTLLALEVNRCSAEYDWQARGPRPGFSTLTLNPNEGRAGLGARDQTLRLTRALDDFAPDCVFIPGWSRSYALAALRWCGARGIPGVVMSDTTEQDLLRSSWKEWLKRQIIANCASAFVGGSPHVDYLVKLGMPRDRVFQGYDVVDNDYFFHNAQMARERAVQFRAEFMLPEQYFLACSRFIEAKNLAVLIEAYSQYRTKFLHSRWLKRYLPGSAPWSFVLLGDGTQRSALEHLIGELRLKAFVSLPGFKQYAELPVYYGLANAFVHASTSEPWGLVVNEAMASGLPVLVSNRCGCVPDLVGNANSEFTFDPSDVEQIAQLMLRLSTSKPLQSSMSAASLEVISNWGLPRCVLGFRSAVKRALMAGPQRGTLRQRFLLKVLST